MTLLRCTPAPSAQTAASPFRPPQAGTADTRGNNSPERRKTSSRNTGRSCRPHGLTNRQVREQLDYEDVGTHQMLTSLCRAGLAERDESASPMVYRLGPKLREG